MHKSGLQGNVTCKVILNADKMCVTITLIKTLKEFYLIEEILKKKTEGKGHWLKEDYL